MTLVEVAHITKTNLHLGLTLDGGHHASLRGLDIVDGGMLRGGTGFGITEANARASLAENLSWATVTNGGITHPRNEYPLPEVTA